MTSYKASLPPNLYESNMKKLQESAKSFDAETNGIINKNTDRHSAFTNKFNQNREALGTYTNDSMMFSMDSPINDKRLAEKYKRFTEISNATTEMLKDISNDINDPETGKKIINADYNNIWFTQHVYMLVTYYNQNVTKQCVITNQLQIKLVKNLICMVTIIHVLLQQ